MDAFSQQSVAHLQPSTPVNFVNNNTDVRHNFSLIHACLSLQTEWSFLHQEMSMGFNLQAAKEKRAFGQEKTFSSTNNRLSVSSGLTAATGRMSKEHIPKERFNWKPQAKTSEEMLVEEIQRKRDLKAKQKQKRQQYYNQKVVKSRQLQENDDEVLAVGVKKVMAQPAT